MTKRKWNSGSAAEWLWAPEQMRWRRTYSGTLSQVTEARRFARALFAGAPCADAVELAVGELATNAVLHSRSGQGAGGWFGLEVVCDDPVYVAVTDMGGCGYPTVRPPDFVAHDLEHGRGLGTLAAIALALGVHGSPALGHTVWVDLDFHPDPEAPAQPARLLAS